MIGKYRRIVSINSANISMLLRATMPRMLAKTVRKRNLKEIS